MKNYSTTSSSYSLLFTFKYDNCYLYNPVSLWEHKIFIIIYFLPRYCILACKKTPYPNLPLVPSPQNQVQPAIYPSHQKFHPFYQMKNHAFIILFLEMISDAEKADSVPQTYTYRDE